MSKELSQCNGKVGYITRDEANKFVKNLNTKQNGTRVKTYKCTTCGFWHYGHEGKKTRMQRYEKSYPVRFNHVSGVTILGVDELFKIKNEQT